MNARPIRRNRIVQRILDEHHLFGDELLVVGDGPVEIREARGRGAIALGVASNEVARQAGTSARSRAWSKQVPTCSSPTLASQKSFSDCCIPVNSDISQVVNSLGEPC